MNKKPLSEDELPYFIQVMLASSSEKAGLFSIPHLFVPQHYLQPQDHWEDTVLSWFSHHGFDGNRARKSPHHSYPALFYEINSPPPWVEIKIEDTVGPISPERQQEIEPLYKQTQKETDLERRYQEYMEQNKKIIEAYRGKDLQEYPLIAVFAERDFRRKLSLARMLGTDVFEKLYEAIFGAFYVDEGLEDGVTHDKGAPDLFVWISQPNVSYWFFAEVKGPTDRIRKSQYEWIKTNWETIKGHIMIISIIETTH